MAENPHVPVPPKPKRSVITRKNDEHKQNCQGWISNRVPWPGNAHHILPVTCFNPLKVKPPSKIKYVLRCIWVSEWDINGGNRFKFSKGSNNMVRLPIFSAYKNSYPSTSNGKFKRATYPVNEPMHNSRYSEHYLYISEVREYLNDEIFSKLQEDKQKHKNKGKSILGELQGAESHFRDELIARGQRNTGTIIGWQTKKSDPDWMLPFSMASDAMTQKPM